jgi:hypothetical protein
VSGFRLNHSAAIDDIDEVMTTYRRLAALGAAESEG